MPAPRSHGFQERFHSSRGHPDAPAHRDDGLVGARRARHHEQRLADREQPDREDDDRDAVEQLRQAEREPRLAGLHVDADEPDGEAEQQADEPAQHRRAEHGGDGGEGEQHQREIVGRAELQREGDDDRREQRQRKGRERAGDERSDRGGGERRRAAAVLRHLVALDGGDDGGILARRVEQDRRGRGAVHGAVVDAAEHDEGADRIELAGRRQQHRDGERRADAGQHADGGAERDADQRPQQIQRRERDGEAVEQGR